MNIKYNVVDIETSIKNVGDEAVGKMKASPFCSENKIVLTGYKSYDMDNIEAGLDLVNGVYCRKNPSVDELIDEVDILVGQNIKFDMLYLMRDMPEVKEWLEEGGQVWDTQLAQYILEGQQKIFPSLDYIAPKYGGTVKDDRIKAFWDEGIDTEDIPEDMLKEYLSYDVLNTEKVFLGQMQEAFDRGMLDLLLSQMEGLVATIEMEFNGMYFDREISSKEALKLHAEMVEVEDYVKGRMEEYIDAVKVTVNPYSPDQLSAVLFGGQLPFKEAVTILDDEGNPVVFKSGVRKGQARTRKEDRNLLVFGMEIATHLTTPTKKKGFYATNEKVLKAVQKKTGTKFITKLLELRKVKKDLTTYFIGYADLTWSDGFIHGSLHHCSTATGRLSSAAPNLQNVSGD